MPDGFSNVYNDDERAGSYAKLEYPGTYWLAFRDLPDMIREHVRGRRALDFGCGTGRSTRFLRDLGFDVVGVDIADSMLAHARTMDPSGDYRLVPDGEFPGFEAGSFDLVLSTFTFDNICTLAGRVLLLRALNSLLDESGRFINLVSSPDIYLHEWSSFSTKDFPENRSAKSGDTVRIVMLDVDDRRPVQDILWTDEDHEQAYRDAGLETIRIHRPLGERGEPFRWVNETEVSPWVIYVSGKTV